MVDVKAATAAEVARMLREITVAVDRGDLAAPRWLRERVRAATVAVSVVGETVPVEAGRDAA